MCWTQKLSLGQASGVAETMTQSGAAILWICQFIERFVDGSGFHGLTRSVQNMTVNFVRVKQLH